MPEDEPQLLSEEWRKREALRLAAQIPALQKAVTDLANSLAGVELVDDLAVSDEVVAQLRPVELHLVVHVLQKAAGGIKSARRERRAPKE